MVKKSHPLTKKELLVELKKIYKEILSAFEKKLDSLIANKKTSKKMDRMLTKIELTLEEFKDIMIIIKVHHEKIKELEEKVKELSEPKRS